MFRRFAKLEASTEPLCGVAVPEGPLPPVEWFCAKLNKSSIDCAELSKLNGNCPGCIVEANEIGKCQSNPHREVAEIKVKS